MRAVLGIGVFFVEYRAYPTYELEVRGLIVAADVVRFADYSTSQHIEDGAAVILHVQPIPNLSPVAVNGERLTLDGVEQD